MVQTLALYVRASTGPVYGALRRTGPAVVRRVGRRLREEAIFVGLWAMVFCAASGVGLLGDAIWQSLGGR